LLIQDRGRLRIGGDLIHAYAQYVYYGLSSDERQRYRSKGRIYHYLGMMEAKLKMTRGCEGPLTARDPQRWAAGKQTGVD
jgi:hypothetical protein